MNSHKLFPGVVAITLACASIIPGGTPQSNVQTDVPYGTRSGGKVLTDSAVTRVEPQYPPLAKAAGVSGQVVVEVTVDEAGNVISARAVSGHPLLRDPAITAACGWKFKPTL